MKTKKDFLENYSSNADLAKKVINQIGLNWKDLIEHPNDYRDASAGVSGFIYYYDTVRFAKRNLVLIMNVLNDFESQCGLLTNKPTDDETQYYNWLAWFALETVIHEVINYIESN